MVLDPAAPLLYAAAQIAAAVVLAVPALFVRRLRRPVKMAAITAAVVLVLVLVFVLTFDLTSPIGRAPIVTTLYVGILGGVIWATVFFILAYIPLALLALMRAQRRAL